MSDTFTAAEVLRRLTGLEDPRVRAINERHGDDHGVRLSAIRALAKEITADPRLARDLWASDDTAARLVAILISKPRDYRADEYDAMLREARAAKVRDWLVSYLVMKSPCSEELRERWRGDADERVAAASWDLTASRIAKKPEGLDLSGLLDEIDAGMASAPATLQWAMNNALGNIGIHHADQRARVLEIGERLGVLRDYPTPPGCVSPFVPIWVNEMVSRQG